MASIGVIVFGLVVMMSGKVEMARLQQAGDTHQFDYDGYRYWAKMDWPGSFNFLAAQSECENLYGAELVKITSDDQYATIQSEVADHMQLGFNALLMWTGLNETADTYQMIMIWSSASTGGTNGKVNHLPSRRGDGYVCQRRNSNASTENTTEPSLSVTQTIGLTTSTSGDSKTPDPSTTTLNSPPTTSSTQPTTTTAKDPATTVPLSSTSATPPHTTITDGYTRPVPKRGSCSEEYIAAMMEYKELLAEYRESFDAWKNSVNL